MEKSIIKMEVVIRNNYNIPQRVQLFCIKDFDNDSETGGLPEWINVDIVLYAKTLPPRHFTYRQFMQSILLNPFGYASILSTTNNRKLYFFVHDMYGNIHPVIPQITPKGVHFTKDEGDVWNPRKHNIADTHEALIFDGKISTVVYLSRKQVFKIEIGIDSMRAISKNVIGPNINLKS